MIQLRLDNPDFAKAIKKFSLGSKELPKAFRAAVKRAGMNLRDEIIDIAQWESYAQTWFIKGGIYVRENKDSVKLRIDNHRTTAASFYLSPRKRPNTRQRGLHIGIFRSDGINFDPTAFLLKDDVPFYRFGGRQKDIRAYKAPSPAATVVGSMDLNKLLKKTGDVIAAYFWPEARKIIMGEK